MHHASTCSAPTVICSSPLLHLHAPLPPPSLGGAITVESKSQLTSTDSHFTGNQAIYGGAINLDDGVLLLEGSNFFDGKRGLAPELFPAYISSQGLEYYKTPGHDVKQKSLVEGGRSSCGIGTYGACSNESLAPGLQAVACAINTCHVCDRGKCLSFAGGTSKEDCAVCNLGHFSDVPGSETCAVCQVRLWTTCNLHPKFKTYTKGSCGFRSTSTGFFFRYTIFIGCIGQKIKSNTCDLMIFKFLDLWFFVLNVLLAFSGWYSGSFC